jgi:tetratricopeptide (TPR) repeat protein
MRSCGWLVPALALLLLDSSALARPNPHLKRGIKLLHDMEDARALVELQRALRVRDSSADEQAEVYVYIGIAQFNLLRTEQARASFGAALDRNPNVELPPMTSPKIRQVFESVRNRRGAVEPRPEPEPGPEPPVPTFQPDQQGRPAPVIRRTRRPRPTTFWGRYWPALTLLGVGVAAAGAGVGCGVTAASEAEKSKDVNLPYEEARAHYDEAGRRALAANVMYGVAGAAALTSAVLFWYYATRRPAEPPTSAAVLPLRSGVVLQVGARW